MGEQSGSKHLTDQLVTFILLKSTISDFYIHIFLSTMAENVSTDLFECPFFCDVKWLQTSASKNNQKHFSEKQEKWTHK